MVVRIYIKLECLSWAMMQWLLGGRRNASIRWLCYEVNRDVESKVDQIRSKVISLSNHEPTRYPAMKVDTRGETFQYVIHPNSDDSARILEDLQLASNPSSSQVHERIEQTFLLPPQTLPSQWLPSYQMLDGFGL